MTDETKKDHEDPKHDAQANGPDDTLATPALAPRQVTSDEGIALAHAQVIAGHAQAVVNLVASGAPAAVSQVHVDAITDHALALADHTDSVATKAAAVAAAVATPAAASSSSVPAWAYAAIPAALALLALLTYAAGVWK